MANKLTSKQWINGQAWLYDIFWLNGQKGNRTTPCDPARDTWYYSRYYASLISEVKAIYNAIKFGPREVSYHKFKDLDTTLQILAANGAFYPTLETAHGSQVVTRPPDTLAKYIAAFCALRKIYWFDGLMTSYEMDEIKKTLLGEALWNYECFCSQLNKPELNIRQGQSITPSVQASSNKGYKSSFGALSGKIKNLVGSPNVKIQAPSAYVYCIEADKNKYLPSAYVKVLDKNGSTLGATDQVDLGRGNDYFDCKLYWFDPNDAAKVLQALINRSPQYQQNYSNLHVAKANKDPNGYFEISTDCGNAYIKASKLNEEIKEATVVSKQTPKNIKKTNAYQIQNIEVFEEAFNKYLD